MGGGKVEYNNVISMLGLVTNENLFKLSDAIIERNTQKALTIIDDMVMSGKDIQLFIKDLIIHYRNLLMAKVSNSPESIIDMALEQIELLKEQSVRIRTEEIMRNIRLLQECEEQSRVSKQARLYLEIAVIKLSKIEYDTSPEVILTRVNKLEDAIKSGRIAVAAAPKDSKGISSAYGDSKKQLPSKGAKAKTEEGGSSYVNSSSKVNIDMVKRAWNDVLENLKSRRNMLIYASLVTGRAVSCQGGIIEVMYEEEYAFNKIRLEKDENRKIVDEVFSEILKDKLKVVYSVDRKEQRSRSTEEMLIEAFGEDNIKIVDE